VGVAVELTGDHIALEVVASGTFAAPDDIRALERTWSEFGDNALGRLLGVQRPVREPQVTLRGDLLRLSVVLALRPILLGLHNAVAADVWEMMTLDGAGMDRERE
jgi:hypothetical protein